MPRRDPSDPREWLRRARSSLALASTTPASPEVLYEELCFEAQQAAEKAVKSVLSVNCWFVVALAIPKSMTTGKASPSSVCVTRILEGLISR